MWRYMKITNNETRWTSNSLAPHVMAVVDPRGTIKRTNQHILGQSSSNSSKFLIWSLIEWLESSNHNWFKNTWEYWRWDPEDLKVSSQWRLFCYKIYLMAKLITKSMENHIQGPARYRSIILFFLFFIIT